MIETAGLERSYGTKVALRHLSLRVEPGEILGFLGPNGAGKTTTVKILAGMLRPTAGRASAKALPESTLVAGASGTAPAKK